MATSSQQHSSSQANNFNSSNQFKMRPATYDLKKSTSRGIKHAPNQASRSFATDERTTRSGVPRLGGGHASASAAVTATSSVLASIVKNQNTSGGEQQPAAMNNNDSNTVEQENENNFDHFQRESTIGSELEAVDIIEDDDHWDTDIEEEAEKPKDFSCEGVYLEQCTRTKVIPVSYVLRHMNDNELKLKHHGLGAAGVRPVSAALMNNTLITKLDLSDNWLGSKGSSYISQMLKENCFISELTLSDNHLSTSGCEFLNQVLKQNNSLTHLTFQGNDFDDSTAPIWADVISSTVRIEYLDLSHNNFGEESGKILGQAIAENASIKTLNLSWNNIRRKGAIAIAKSLSVNAGLKKFDISWNGFAQEGAKAFLKALKENEVLEELDLSNNRIATEGAVYIAKGLIGNQTLRILRIGNNPMESAGCYAVIKALQKNPTSKLENIDFSGIVVNKYFKDELRVFSANFPNTRVLIANDGNLLKTKPKIHPVFKFKNFLDKCHIQLADVFKKFDPDLGLNMPTNDFHNWIKDLKMNFKDEELTTLVQEFDRDGTGIINYNQIEKRLNSAVDDSDGESQFQNGFDSSTNPSKKPSKNINKLNIVLLHSNNKH